MKKGQAAMEYLMTYGWAILIIIVVVAALYAMGVFKVGKPTVPCSPCFSYFAFVDYADGTLIIRNGAREVNITVSSTPAGATTTDCTAATPCRPGDDIRITGIPTTGDVTVTIDYTDRTSWLTHTDSAVIHNP